MSEHYEELKKLLQEKEKALEDLRVEYEEFKGKIL